MKMYDARLRHDAKWREYTRAPGHVRFLGPQTLSWPMNERPRISMPGEKVNDRMENIPRIVIRRKCNRAQGRSRELAFLIRCRTKVQPPLLELLDVGKLST